MHDDPPDAALGDHTPDPKPDLKPGRATAFDLLGDWATIWQSEMAALALDRELDEIRTALVAAACPAPAATAPGSAAIDE